jgi:demethylmenaquinone methyltransferase/2-methoxy-6-polyprenyl-1,4-benzoquinol methylase
LKDKNGVLPPVEEKPRFVQQMFTEISARYDLMNRIMTLGQDQKWRRMVVRFAQLPPGGRFLDVATGTGDIGYEVLKQHPDASVVGLDFSPGMIEVGRRKHPGMEFPFVMGDALHLPFPDNSFDAAASGFMMRNVVDIERAFREQARVVKPGGRVICLEITRPSTPVWKDLFHVYFFKLVPFIGQLVSKRKQAYTYLPHSTVAFPRPDALKGIMESAGLADVSYRILMLGTVAIHVGVKK